MATRILNIIKNISLKNKLYLIISTMIAFIVVQLISLLVMMFLFSAIRASVSGEAQWSKGIKNAIFYLHEYAYFHREDDYQKYLNAIAIPLGDMRARIELEKSHPNLKITREGLLQGRNNPDDIASLIIQFRYFHKVPFINNAIASWAAGDPPLLELQKMGLQIHMQIIAGIFTAADLTKSFDKITYLNMHMSKLADNYSNMLGEGSRSLMRIVFITLLSLAILTGMIGLLFVLTMVTEIKKGIWEIIRVSKKVETFDFSDRAKKFADDEMGLLATGINHMIDELEKSTAKKKQLEDQLRYLAQHDALTGLITRRLLYDRLKQVVAASTRNKQKAAVFYIDIDNFKIINDTLGHEMGDSLLKEVSARLVTGVRAIDSVARMGGDEFVLIFPDVINNQAAVLIAQKIINIFGAPILLDNKMIPISISIGIAICPDDGEDSRALIKNADKALYHVKENGRNNYQFYGKYWGQA